MGRQMGNSPLGLLKRTGNDGRLAASNPHYFRAMESAYVDNRN